MQRPTEDINIDYPTILLRHIDRLGKLSTEIQGQIVGTNYTIYREADKKQAFILGVAVFRQIVSSTLKDKVYEIHIEEAKAQHKDDPFKQALSELGILVDLLGRKGKLYSLSVSVNI